MRQPVDGWWPTVPLDAVGTAPVEVTTGDRAWVAFRPEPGAPVGVVEARCPHRLVRLAHGTVVDGTVQCPYHGWRFGPDGACTLVPSNGPAASVPPRARLAAPWGVREADGVLWVAPVDPAVPGSAPPDLRATEETLTNLDASLEAGWHPLLLVDEVPDHGQVAARLLGREYSVGRAGDGFAVTPPVARSAVRFDVLWVAPAEPRVPLLECADDTDPLFAPGWLEPDRSASPAGVLAENFLDAAHFPFVHVGTFGAAEETYVEPFDVESDGDGLVSVQDQWFDNPEDPAVLQGIRPVRQRRRSTYVHRWPFQLLLRLEELDAGAVKTILFFLQPEAADSTRVYTKMLFHGIGGVAVPPPDVVAKEVAFEVAVLGEDLALQAAMTVRGLPLRMRDELHVRSDRSGVALRRVLARHRSPGAVPDPTDPEA
ncbi:Rieske 2Fe-2S domain-containing protein [Kineosporia sp. A_224]|uniref:Rieske 2Fe-2S domain-containing protein n=1 Tax=Kineosporia sp. A_224 TaxID=1962180 RepID=UPI000B4A9B3C|nr:Rieske 2Fe-2S domain-containing protein [Kineosporia sp. A_224]